MMLSKKYFYIKVVVVSLFIFLFVYSVSVISNRIHNKDKKTSEQCFTELKNTLPKNKLIEIMQKKTITQSYCDFLK